MMPYGPSRRGMSFAYSSAAIPSATEVDNADRSVRKELRRASTGLKRMHLLSSLCSLLFFDQDLYYPFF